MKNFKEFYGAYQNLLILNEIKDLELHPEINNILNSSHSFNRGMFNKVTSVARKLIKNNEPTGLSDDRPKKGSSRAVLFPKNPHKITLDGKEAHVPSVLKIAFHGHLDHLNDSGALLGQHQNMTEGDHFAQKEWGIIHPTDDHKPNSYATNHESGILSPVFDKHPDDHWLHVGRVKPAKAGDFRALTKTPEFPKGITHDEMYHTLMHHHEAAHGRNWNFKGMDYDRITEHPFVHNTLNFVQTMGQHPGDYVRRNMGVFEHPSGSKHLVISDYGFSHEVARQYAKIRNKITQNIRR